MTKKRHDRAVLVKLECGHTSKLNASRSRVQKSVAACIYGHHIRRGVWCFDCGAKCHPVEMIGVVRA